MARIMIADDHSSIRLLISSLVTQAGHEVVLEASDGLDALHGYFEVKPDLFILDIQMPKLDGVSVVKQVRRADPKAKILLCSGLFEANDRLGLEKGVYTIRKPFDVNEFMRTVNAALGEPEGKQ